ncbi:MAG: hypothetical protein ABIJ26_08320 [Candidatus Margulisiibacteriota bacterium]
MKFTLQRRFSHFREGMKTLHPFLEIARAGISGKYQLSDGKKATYARRIARSHQGWAGMEGLLDMIGKTDDRILQIAYARRVADFVTKNERRLGLKAEKAYGQGGKARSEYDVEIRALYVLATKAVQLLHSGRLSDGVGRILDGNLLDL